MIRAAAVAIVWLSVSAGLSAQAPLPDPWTRVPPLPTTCYRDGDFERAMNELVAQNNDDYVKQKEINIDVETKFQQMDMQERMRRMQEYMMKNPQAAMKAMQAGQAAATDMSSDITSADEAKQRLDAEFERQQAAWSNDFDKAAEPWRARRKELTDTKTRLSGPIHVWVSADAEAEYNGLIQKENAEYEKRCASHYGPNGTVQTWLATYKREVIDKKAAAEEAQDSQKLMQMSMADFPPGGFRTTVPFTAVREYLGALDRVYGLRRHKLTTRINP